MTTFYLTENIRDPLTSPTELVETSYTGEAFRKVFGDPVPGWTSKTFDYRSPEWVWRRIHRPILVKGADIGGRIVLAISTSESFYEFLAFVEYRFKLARVGS